MLEIMLIIMIGAFAAWRFLEYLNGMATLQKRLRRDSLMQIKCKTLADNYSEQGKFVCVKCTDIKGDKNEQFNFRL